MAFVAVLMIDLFPHRPRADECLPDQYMYGATPPALVMPKMNVDIATFVRLCRYLMSNTRPRCCSDTSNTPIIAHSVGARHFSNAAPLLYQHAHWVAGFTVFDHRATFAPC